MINDRDHAILRAFLERESDCYRWLPETEKEHRKEFIDKLFKTITEAGGYGPINYVHIRSITNMGWMDSELVLTGKPWGWGKSAYINLPASPRGNASISIQEGG